MQGSELKRHSRELIRLNSPKLFVVVIVYVVINAVLAELQYRLPGIDGAFERFIEQIAEGEIPSVILLFSGVRPTGAALATLIALITPIIGFGFIGYCLKISRGLSGDYRDLFDGFLYFPKILLITILIYIFVFLWSLLLIFPGFIAAYRYRQAYYILLEDPKKGALQCIRESKRMMRGRKLDLFLLDFSFIGWYFLSGIIVYLIPFPLPVVSIWLEPYIGIAHAGFYNELAGFVMRQPPD